jgi:hypothetical protein
MARVCVLTLFFAPFSGVIFRRLHSEKKKKTRLNSRSLITAAKNPVVIAFIIIFLLGIFFRFANTPERFGFDKDPTRDALISLYGARNLEYPLIGPHSGIGGFTFGPWYYYILITATLLFPFPYTPFYVVPIFSLLFIVVMFFIGKELKDPVLGLILAGFAALSPGQVGPTAGLSNPNFVSPHAALVILFFVLYWKKDRPVWFSLLWGLLLGIGINHHYQLLPFILFPIVAYVYRRKTSLKHIPVFLGGLIAAFIPLLLFNYLHNWHTVVGFLTYVTGDGGNYIPNSWTLYVRDFWPRFWSYLFGLPVQFGILFAVIVAGIHSYLLLKKKISLVYGVVISVFLFLFILLRYYSGSREYYYLFFLQPLLFLIAGMALWQLWQSRLGKIGFVIVISVLLFFMYKADTLRLVDREDFLSARSEAEALADANPKTKVQLYNCRDLAIHRTEGVAYFLEVQHKIEKYGKKIGIAEGTADCQLPETVTKSENGIYDFSHVSEQELIRTGWKPISGKSVYNETVLWWENDEKYN